MNSIALVAMATPWWASETLATVLLGVVGIATFIAAIEGFRKSVRAQRQAQARFRATLRGVQKIEFSVAERFSKPADTAFSTLWATNQKRIDVYHEIATAQARRSFLSSQIATYAGFVVVVGLGIAAAMAPTVAGSITSAGVGVIAGGLSAYMGATFMKSQAQATAQLRRFFAQPMEFTRLLGAERLLETLPDADKSAAILSIIERMTFSIDGPSSEK